MNQVCDAWSDTICVRKLRVIYVMVVALKVAHCNQAGFRYE